MYYSTVIGWSLDYLWYSIVDVRNVKMIVNYGIESLKFQQPVLVNDKIRATVSLHEIKNLRGIAKVTVKEGQISVQCLTRSSVETSKFDLANALRSAFELMGCEVTFTGSYPGWTPNVNSPILDVLVNIYEKQNGAKPNVVACHAALECGIL